ncbi:hypothetical protein LWC34_56210 [Kibdelosporangium philippinense]|uniref:ABC-2 family transporter protein n=1 Tax=Kibdelosporangium philippinense TaxID=211113 RepID=A0ABS8ZXX9_9PSEU|nr:hypothetical protein [Kibdelosporangium philippinense]MCE7012100.1 hypothetical protein [Kibdelosporangium philippinense]
MIKAEFLKLKLPAILGALGIAGVLSFADTGDAPVVFAQAGFIVLGVVAITSEYQGRQIYTTLAVTPRRIPIYLSKMVVLLSVAAPTAVLVGRASETAVHLVLTTLIAASVASVLRRTIPAIAGLLGYYFILSPFLYAAPPDTVIYAIGAAAAVGIATALFRLRDA